MTPSKLWPLLALGATGCMAADVWRPLPPVVSWVDCAPDERVALSAADALGDRAVHDGAFSACVRALVGRDYRPCLDRGGDPLASAPRAAQVEGVLAAVRESLTANLEVRCATLSRGTKANAVVEPGDEVDQLRVARWLLARTATNLDEAPRDRARTAWLAGVLWHERMHQRGYRHPDDAAEYGAGPRCGYPVRDAPDDYARELQSAPYIVGACVYAAALGDHAVLRDEDGAVTVGLGRTALSPPVATESIDALVLPARSVLRVCGARRGGGEVCQSVDNRGVRVEEDRGGWAQEQMARITSLELTRLPSPS